MPTDFYRVLTQEMEKQAALPVRPIIPSFVQHSTSPLSTFLSFPPRRDTFTDMVNKLLRISLHDIDYCCNKIVDNKL